MASILAAAAPATRTDPSTRFVPESHLRRFYVPSIRKSSMTSPPLRQAPLAEATPYFAYGSNLCQSELERTVGAFEVLGPAILRDYRLAFTRFSKSRRCGVADIVPAIGFTVRGVVYRLTTDSWGKLDAREGTAVGAYARKEVPVTLQNGDRICATAYVVAHRSVSEHAPSAEYMELLLRGARDHELEPAYVRYLEWLANEARAPHFGEGLLVRESRPPDRTGANRSPKSTPKTVRTEDDARICASSSPRRSRQWK